MLNIPEEVKNLFRQDSITKNFRIHFPNGERADLTNADLVEESVQFTESLCSQESLKFGLCEASVLEFETIDVENITGCVIEASIEIAVSGTEAEALDGTVTWKDGRKAYPVPLGRFAVDSAKRQKNLRRRNVTAYDALCSGNLDKDLSDLGITRPNEYGYITLGAPLGYNYSEFFHFNINHYLRMYAVNSKMSGTAQEFGEPAGSFAEKEDSTESTIAIRDHTLGVGATLYVKDRIYTPQTDVVTNFGLDSSLKLEAFDSKVRSIIRETCQKHGIVFDDLTKMPNPVVVRLMRTMPDTAEPPEAEAQGNAVLQADTAVPDLELIAPYITPGLMIEWSDFSGLVQLTMQVPLRLEIYSTGGSEDAGESGTTQITVLETVTFDECPEVELYSYSPDSMLNFRMKENARITTYRNLLCSYLEINGMFGKCSRNGPFEYIRIQDRFDLYPSEELYPSEDLFPAEASAIVPASTYASVWYEEAEVKPYGRAVVEYTDTEGKEQVFAYTFDEASSNVYYFKDNYIFRNVQMTEETAKALLDTYFIPNIKGISYVPAEIEMSGLPYVEAGDILNILTPSDGFETIVLRRTLTGIQSLADNVEAEGNEGDAEISAE